MYNCYPLRLCAFYRPAAVHFCLPLASLVARARAAQSQMEAARTSTTEWAQAPFRGPPGTLVESRPQVRAAGACASVLPTVADARRIGCVASFSSLPSLVISFYPRHFVLFSLLLPSQRLHPRHDNQRQHRHQRQFLHILRLDDPQHLLHAGLFVPKHLKSRFSPSSCPSSPSSPPPPAPTPSRPSTSSSSKLGTGAIAVIAVGVVLVGRAAAFARAWWFCCYSRKARERGGGGVGGTVGGV
ncbi:hypothetical protein B0H19DRAFT_194530 [Mycena capillaripes]|nr:hypothetical protein B0H19DRAFT_194530 [Mycena capillaripes]